MLYDDRDRSRVRDATLTVTALAWILLLWPSSQPAGIPAGLHAVPHAVPGSRLSAVAMGERWSMLAAMMAPVLIAPLQLIRASAFARRRARATLLFLSGYTAVWMLVFAAMGSVVARWGALGLSPYVQAAGTLVMALVWQCSPAKQTCLNRCHAVPALAAFGRAADVGALRYGASHGLWCAGSCWVWMLLPLLLPAWHTAAMIAATMLISSERLDGATRPSWRWRAPAKARRIVTARLQIWTAARVAHA